jgi:hypothetical protein
MGDSHFLFFGKGLDRYARARNGDIKHLPAGRDDNARIGVIAPELADLHSQPPSRRLVDFVPAVKQQQKTAVLGEP